MFIAREDGYSQRRGDGNCQPSEKKPKCHYQNSLGWSHLLPFGIWLSVFGKALISLQTENSRVVLQHNYMEEHLSILKRTVARGGPK